MERMLVFPLCMLCSAMLPYLRWSHLCLPYSQVYVSGAGFETSCDCETTQNVELIEDPHTLLLWASVMFSTDNECWATEGTQGPQVFGGGGGSIHSCCPLFHGIFCCLPFLTVV